MHDLGDPLVREAIREARDALGVARDLHEEATEKLDQAMTLVDRLDDLAAECRLRVVS